MTVGLMVITALIFIPIISFLFYLSYKLGYKDGLKTINDKYNNTNKIIEEICNNSTRARSIAYNIEKDLTNNRSLRFLSRN